jgi:hypothetical protein
MTISLAAELKWPGLAAPPAPTSAYKSRIAKKINQK